MTTRRPWSVAVALAVTAAPLCLAAGCSSSAPSSSRSAGVGAASSSAAPPPGHLAIDGGPDWLAADGSWLFVKLDAGAVLRVDPRTATVAGTTQIGGTVCQGLGVGFGSVWSCKGTSVVRIDPTRDAVVATIDVGKTAEQGHLVTGFGHVWIIVDDGRSIVGIDPATNRPGPPIALPIRATELAIDGDHIWVSSAVDHAVVRVVPATGAVDGRVDDLGSVLTLASNGAVVFVAAPDRVTRLDAGSLALLGTIATGPGDDGSISVVGPDLWIHRAGELLRVPGGEGDPVTVPVDTVTTSAGDSLFAFDAVWASANDDDLVLRVTSPGAG